MQPKRSTSKSEKAPKIARQWNGNTLLLFLFVIATACITVSKPVFAEATSQAITTATTSQAADPNKGASEFNHHIAGWAMVGIGLLALASLLSPNFKSQRCVWPVLFVLAGLFLALWSDGEIWPRGNLSWAWLLRHDAEARQHKIYSLLLIALGIVEYLRIRGALPRFWKTWAFPAIAVIGAGMLLIHDHGAGSGVNSPEAQAYLVDPDLDVDGNPRGLSASNTVANGTEDQNQPLRSCCGPADPTTVHAGYMPMDHSHMEMDVSPVSAGPTSHHHHMTASMVRVERQHLWFVFVGLAIGIFKFISDSELFRSRIVPCIWPSCTMLLGLMLVFYRE